MIPTPDCLSAWQTDDPFTPLATLLLQVAAKRGGFVGCWWGSRTAWEPLGGTPSGDGTTIYDEQWRPIEVWCIDQVEGSSVDRLRVRECDAVSEEHADFGRIDRLIDETEADIRVGVGDRNHSTLWDGYVPPNPWISFPFHTKGDYILLRSPNLRSRSSQAYTILHELVHWAEVRTRWMDEMPARELVAEIGSGWLALELGCPPCFCEINHRSFMPEWLRAMRVDPEYLVRGVIQARAAFDVVMRFSAARSFSNCPSRNADDERQ